jgi:hypothetical protein
MSLYLRGKSPRYPLDRRLCRPQSRPGRYGEVNVLEPTDRSAVQPVASRYTDCATECVNDLSVGNLMTLCHIQKVLWCPVRLKDICVQ